MRRLLLFSSLLFLNTLFSQENIYCSIETVKDVSFNIIKSLDSSDLNISMNQMISLQSLKELIDENDHIDEIKENEIIERREKFLNQIIEQSEGYTINWDKIVFKDFTFRMENEEEFKLLGGRLYFSYNEEIFRVRTEAIYYQHQFHIVELRGFMKVDEIK
jgi:hypothetical protein